MIDPGAQVHLLDTGSGTLIGERFSVTAAGDGITVAQATASGWVSGGVATMRLAAIGDGSETWGLTNPGDGLIAHGSEVHDRSAPPPFLFQGMQWDAQTELYDAGNGTDYVDPKTNRFLTPDKAHSTFNDEVFEGNSDLNRIDPSGEISSFLGTDFNSGIQGGGFVLSDGRNYDVAGYTNAGNVSTNPGGRISSSGSTNSQLADSMNSWMFYLPPVQNSDNTATGSTAGLFDPFGISAMTAGAPAPLGPHQTFGQESALEQKIINEGVSLVTNEGLGWWSNFGNALDAQFPLRIRVKIT